MLALIKIDEGKWEDMEEIIYARGGDIVCTDRDGIITEPFVRSDVESIIDSRIREMKSHNHPFMNKIEKSPTIKVDYMNAVIRHFRENSYVALDEEDIEHVAWEKFQQMAKIYSALDGLIDACESIGESFAQTVRSNDVIYHGVANQAEHWAADKWRNASDVEELDTIITDCVSRVYEKERKSYLRDGNKNLETKSRKSGGR